MTGYGKRAVGLVWVLVWAWALAGSVPAHASYATGLALGADNASCRVNGELLSVSRIVGGAPARPGYLPARMGIRILDPDSCAGGAEAAPDARVEASVEITEEELSQSRPGDPVQLSYSRAAKADDRAPANAGSGGSWVWIRRFGSYTAMVEDQLEQAVTRIKARIEINHPVENDASLQQLRAILADFRAVVLGRRRDRLRRVVMRMENFANRTCKAPPRFRVSVPPPPGWDEFCGQEGEALLGPIRTCERRCMERR